MNNLNTNPELDLFFERIVDVPRELIWKAWTVPEHMLPWFLSAALENGGMRC